MRALRSVVVRSRVPDAKVIRARDLLRGEAADASSDGAALERRLRGRLARSYARQRRVARESVRVRAKQALGMALVRQQSEMAAVLAANRQRLAEQLRDMLRDVLGSIGADQRYAGCIESALSKLEAGSVGAVRVHPDDRDALDHLLQQEGALPHAPKIVMDESLAPGSFAVTGWQGIQVFQLET